MDFTKTIIPLALMASESIANWPHRVLTQMMMNDCERFSVCVDGKSGLEKLPIEYKAVIGHFIVVGLAF